MNSCGYIRKRRGIYPPLGTDPEGDSCFSIYQNNAMEMHFIFKETIQCKPFFNSICSSALSNFFEEHSWIFSQFWKQKDFVLRKNPNLLPFSCLLQWLSSSVTEGKRDAILTSFSKSTNCLGYREHVGQVCLLSDEHVKRSQHFIQHPTKICWTKCWPVLCIVQWTCQMVPTFHSTSTKHLSDQMLASFVYCRMNMSNGPDISPNMSTAYLRQMLDSFDNCKKKN